MNFSVMYPIACLVLTSTIQPALSDQLSLRTQPFNEELRASAQISGARFVGFATIAASLETGAPTVTAHVPASWAAADVCLRVMSADGRYQSENAYTLGSDWQGGSLDLDYPTRFAGDLAEFGQNLAVMLTAGLCEDPVAEATPVHWGGDATDMPLSIALNTARSDETYLFFPARSDLPDVLCTRSDADVQTAFDTLCPIPDNLLEPQLMEAVVVSFKNGELGSESALKINLAPQQ
ncbi:hypothetical protein MLD63_16285 [Paracoccus sp. TK19116]|uniref:DUF1007 family protein n=1 Tax=Paracoccus albicereus TaxID=2922394 RepID=A0ABT1MUH0_9RHOB|nr:hypothetical protein [Paracoccus albicereus]MCQ0971982.1 hypothetical protein [Paracoccus albicereus]